MIEGSFISTKTVPYQKNENRRRFRSLLARLQIASIQRVKLQRNRLIIRLILDSGIRVAELQCGAGMILLADGGVLGYRIEQVNLETGHYHSWFLADGKIVDFRLALIPEMLRGRNLWIQHMAPKTIPLFCWGAVPPWLHLQAQHNGGFRGNQKR